MIVVGGSGCIGKRLDAAPARLFLPARNGTLTMQGEKDLEPSWSSELNRAHAQASTPKHPRHRDALKKRLIWNGYG